MLSPTQSIHADHADYVMKMKMFFIKIIHFLITVILFYGMFLLFRYGRIVNIIDRNFRHTYFVTLAFAVVVSFFNRTYNSYLFGYSRIRTLALAQFLSQFFSLVILYFSISIGWNKWYTPLLWFVLLAVYALLDMSFSYFGNKIYSWLNPPRKTLLLYRSKRDMATSAS